MHLLIFKERCGNLRLDYRTTDKYMQICNPDLGYRWEDDSSESHALRVPIEKQKRVKTRWLPRENHETLCFHNVLYLFDLKITKHRVFTMFLNFFVFQRKVEYPGGELRITFDIPKTQKRHTQRRSIKINERRDRNGGI